MSNFSITQITVNFGTENPQSPDIYVVNVNTGQHIWGYSCSNTVTNPSPAIPITNQPGGSSVSNILISAFGHNYQMYWQDGANPGEYVVLLQWPNSPYYPNNQVALYPPNGSPAVLHDGKNFVLHFDLTAANGMKGITLMPVSI